MSNRRTLLTCGVLGVFVLTLMAADKPPDDYSKAMKEIGAAAQSLSKAVPAEDFDTVSKNAATIIDAFPVVEKYWTGKAEDALRVVRTATKAAADLRVAAGLKSGEGIAYSAKELTDACMQCHTAHRERLPDGTFQIK